ncbi:S16 family serine protease [Shewanella sp. FJAT-52076]|uniref:S16 family serine protease n=1 Tax=Shewanella sp. FJAT-52076 TaxID=2864202 RepID=UPI001C65D9D9|nr:S16 family serine protease [Shewanella sp. FJAT-52076]QYJ77209.1 AAA family ATPase [Shewanella sp. FJAT-52076]
MHPSLIAAERLSPAFHLPSGLSDNPGIGHLLLCQDRLLDAFTLASQIPAQHLFLADFPGVHRESLFRALAQSAPVPPRELVVRRNDAGTQLVWETARQGEHGSLARELGLFTVLGHQIKRTDLLGAMVEDSSGKAQYRPGVLASYPYIFICVEALYRREGLWQVLLDVLDKGSYRVGKEMNIPLQSTIILVGSALQYSELRAHDSSFSRHFPLLGEMAHELNLTVKSEQEYGLWLKALAHEGGYQLDDSAMAPLFNFAARECEHQQRLSLSGQDLVQLFAQAAVYGRSDRLDANAIDKAIKQLTRRHNSSERFSAQSFDDSFINLPTSGEMIGQINGLTVIDSVDYAYGEPARITATVHYGDGEVADIERKSELGGNIHAKGMMILSACLYRIFGRDAPLHLNANIVFEQSYQEIDGDSASLAEYCCLMSAIAEQPIKQSLAITGALDQFGNVQAIGGVNEKIEGFFNLCERRGLTGEQGVIIPKANMLQLNLDRKVIDAASKGLFHIYQVAHMDEAVELLMALPAGKADEEHNFPENTLYGLVQARLDKLAGDEPLDEPQGIFASLLAKWPFSRA